MKAVKINGQVIIYDDEKLPPEFSKMAIDVPVMPQAPEGDGYELDIIDGVCTWVYRPTTEQRFADMAARIAELENILEQLRASTESKETTETSQDVVSSAQFWSPSKPSGDPIV